MKDVCILGVDLGKNSCSVVGLDGSGRVLLRRRTRREGVIALAAKLPGCVVAMEASSFRPQSPSGKSHACLARRRMRIMTEAA